MAVAPPKAKSKGAQQSRSTGHDSRLDSERLDAAKTDETCRNDDAEECRPLCDTSPLVEHSRWRTKSDSASRYRIARCFGTGNPPVR